MDAKLTLQLDKTVIEKAKIYAAKQKVSLSFIVENYLKAITSMEKTGANEGIKISEFVKNISIGKMEKFQPILITKKKFRKCYQKNMMHKLLFSTLCLLISKTPEFQH